MEGLRREFASSEYAAFFHFSTPVLGSEPGMQFVFVPVFCTVAMRFVFTLKSNRK
jgi:hypothetical protein